MAVAAIFDIDGTLVSFKFDAQGTRRALLDELTARRVDTTGLDLNSTTQTILDTAQGRMDGSYADFKRRAFEILDEFELKDIATTKPFPGMRDTLVALKSRGVRLAVVTNSGRKAAARSLAVAQLAGFFEFVLTRNDTETMKPRPEGLLQAVALLSLPKDQVYYVGDTPFDVMAARAAGVRCVSVATGNYTPERLASEGADVVISSISELGRALGVEA